MSVAMSCRVTQLLYVTAPQLNFAQVVSDLHAALTSADFAAPALTWDCDDIAFIDFDAERVVVGYTENLVGIHAACLTIAAGGLPRKNAAKIPDIDQVTLCDAVTARFDKRFPSDAQRKQLIGHPLTADLIDRVVDALFLQQEVLQGKEVACDAGAMPDNESLPSQGDVEKLLNKFSLELVSRPTNLITRAIAMAIPNARTLGNTVGPVAVDGPAQHANNALSGRPKRLFAGRAFWQNPATKEIRSTTGAADHSKHRDTSRELQAVRDALYAADQSGVSLAPKRYVEKLGLQMAGPMQWIGSLPVQLARGVSDMRRHREMGERVRH